ncbi:hypothetical protein G7Y89_g5832 [Cudoniella acicularis]|uniref:Uncharacterized protein n=1 Tax=Cudoniella acicularis TaxID=354080 RepID=A0A8H4W321_9HELO|nr:hypothetical protein G7Y89_g5832 [Cudoniella acicularis]
MIPASECGSRRETADAEERDFFSAGHDISHSLHNIALVHRPKPDATSLTPDSEVKTAKASEQPNDDTRKLLDDIAAQQKKLFFNEFGNQNNDDVERGKAVMALRSSLKDCGFPMYLSVIEPDSTSQADASHVKLTRARARSIERRSARKRMVSILLKNDLHMEKKWLIENALKDKLSAASKGNYVNKNQFPNVVLPSVALPNAHRKRNKPKQGPVVSTRAITRKKRQSHVSHQAENLPRVRGGWLTPTEENKSHQEDFREEDTLEDEFEIEGTLSPLLPLTSEKESTYSDSSVSSLWAKDQHLQLTSTSPPELSNGVSSGPYCDCLDCAAHDSFSDNESLAFSYVSSTPPFHRHAASEGQLNANTPPPSHSTSCSQHLSTANSDNKLSVINLHGPSNLHNLNKPLGSSDNTQAGEKTQPHRGDENGDPAVNNATCNRDSAQSLPIKRQNSSRCLDSFAFIPKTMDKILQRKHLSYKNSRYQSGISYLVRWFPGWIPERLYNFIRRGAIRAILGRRDTTRGPEMYVQWNDSWVTFQGRDALHVEHMLSFTFDNNIKMTKSAGDNTERVRSWLSQAFSNVPWDPMDVNALEVLKHAPSLPDTDQNTPQHPSVAEPRQSYEELRINRFNRERIINSHPSSSPKTPSLRRQLVAAAISQEDESLIAAFPELDPSDTCDGDSVTSGDTLNSVVSLECTRLEVGGKNILPRGPEFVTMNPKPASPKESPAMFPMFPMESHDAVKDLFDSGNDETPHCPNIGEFNDSDSELRIDTCSIFPSSNSSIPSRRSLCHNIQNSTETSKTDRSNVNIRGGGCMYSKSKVDHEQDPIVPFFEPMVADDKRFIWKIPSRIHDKPFSIRFEPEGQRAIVTIDSTEKPMRMLRYDDRFLVDPPIPVYIVQVHRGKCCYYYIECPRLIGRRTPTPRLVSERNDDESLHRRSASNDWGKTGIQMQSLNLQDQNHADEERESSPPTEPFPEFEQIEESDQVLIANGPPPSYETEQTSSHGRSTRRRSYGDHIDTTRDPNVIDSRRRRSDGAGPAPSGKVREETSKPNKDTASQEVGTSEHSEHVGIVRDSGVVDNGRCQVRDESIRDVAMEDVGTSEHSEHITSTVDQRGAGLGDCCAGVTGYYRNVKHSLKDLRKGWARYRRLRDDPEFSNEYPDGDTSGQPTVFIKSGRVHAVRGPQPEPSILGGRQLRHVRWVDGNLDTIPEENDSRNPSCAASLPPHPEQQHKTHSCSKHPEAEDSRLAGLAGSSKTSRTRYNPFSLHKSPIKPSTQGRQISSNNAQHNQNTGNVSLIGERSSFAHPAESGQSCEIRVTVEECEPEEREPKQHTSKGRASKKSSWSRRRSDKRRRRPTSRQFLCNIGSGDESQDIILRGGGCLINGKNRVANSCRAYQTARKGRADIRSCKSAATTSARRPGPRPISRDSSLLDKSMENLPAEPVNARSRRRSSCNATSLFNSDDEKSSVTSQSRRSWIGTTEESIFDNGDSDKDHMPPLSSDRNISAPLQKVDKAMRKVRLREKRREAPAAHRSSDGSTSAGRWDGGPRVMDAAFRRAEKLELLEINSAVKTPRNFSAPLSIKRKREVEDDGERPTKKFQLKN